MPLDFPSSPTNGQYYNGFVWNDSNSTWDSAFAPRPATIPISSPNYIINGAFDIWQRGTSATYSSGSYSADRWVCGSSSTTISRDTDVPANVSQYSLKIVAGAANSIFQRIESANSAPLAGQTVTLSFYYKRTAGTGNVDARFYFPSAVDNFGTTTQIGTTTVLATTPSSSWTRYSTTLTLPTEVSRGLQVLINNDGNTTSYIAGVQLEVGAAPTEFRRNAPSIAGELAACQRYYYRITAENNYDWFSQGQAYGATLCIFPVQFPVTMRAVPSTTLEWSGSFAGFVIRQGAGSLTLTGTPIIANDSDGKPSRNMIQMYWYVTSGGVAGAATRLLGNNTTAAYIGFSAEL